MTQMKRRGRSVLTTDNDDDEDNDPDIVMSLSLVAFTPVLVYSVH